MGLLGVAAHADVAEAQFLLGSLLLSDEDTDEEAGALVRDAEQNRQRSNDPEDARDLRAIRKSARRAYRQYLKEQAAKKGGTEADGKKKKSLVSHARVEELDRAFGVTLRELLDPETALPPIEGDPDAGDQDRKTDSTKAVEWIRRAADNRCVLARLLAALTGSQRG